MCKPLPELPEGYMDYWVFKDLHLGIGKLKDVNPDIAEIQASYLTSTTLRPCTASTIKSLIK